MDDGSRVRTGDCGRRRRNFLQLCREIQAVPARDAGTLAFAPRPLVQAPFPLREVEGETFSRRVGRLSVHLQAPPDVGLPFGRYPRLLLAWIATEAVRTRSPQLDLGASLSAFMRKMAIIPSGGPHGPIRRFTDQVKRVASTSLVVTWQGEAEFGVEGYRIAAHSYLGWDPASRDVTSDTSTLRLSLDFFGDLLQAPIPLDMRALVALHPPLALDLYCWLSYRFFALRRPVAIPLDKLQAQFGMESARLRDFRRGLLGALDLVLHVYPQARLRFEDDRLLLLPSPTHVPV